MKGIQTLTNWASLEIEVVNDEVVKYRFHNGDTSTEWEEAEVEFEFDESGDLVPCFRIEGEAYYFHNFLRI